MSSHTIDLVQGEARKTVTLNEGTDLLSLIAGTDGFHLPAPCNGKGRCGKCRVRVLNGDNRPVEDIGCAITEAERRSLTADELNRGYRLACLCSPRADVTVEIPIEARAAFTKGTLPSVDGTPEPLFERKVLTLPTPILGDQRSDYRRLVETAGQDRGFLSVSAVHRLHSILTTDDYSVAAMVHYVDDNGPRLFGVSESYAEAKYALAVDIGTTTVAAYFVDLDRKEVVDVLSELNRQVAFGADVVSRIDASREKGADALQRRIVEQIQEMGSVLAGRHRVDAASIVACVVAGNTTMIHFLLGADASGIATAPFIPVLSDLFHESAAEVGFDLHPDACLVTLPNISGYVGADIVAAILASELHHSEEMCLLVDIGTNGEIVLGNKDRILCCSTAAGPAFEGAHIQDGVGGVPGAVSEFGYRDGSWTFQTIQGAPPVGVCGSGIVDAIAQLIEDDVLEATGRLKDIDELEGPLQAAYENRLADSAFILVDGAGGRSVRLSQGDIREVQLAKAAIAAGIKTLVDHAGLELSDIHRLYLAGGFGSYIRQSSAVRIGLIPEELRDRVSSIGNAAGTGVVTVLLRRDDLRECRSIMAKAEYVELSNSQTFQDYYIEEMMFPGE